MAGLRVRGLSKSFGNNTVIKDLSFDVSEGEFCILLGPSGCGKTTVLRLIAGLERQDRGEIFIGDREVSDLSPRQRDVAMVFQSYALYPHLDVYENMAFSLRIQRRPRDEIDRRVREAAVMLGIEGLLRRKPQELSGGQRQRVAIGRAIVRSPSLFLFDEPLSNLDAKLRSSMRVELARLHRRLRATMVYVTHDQTEAMTLGEKIIILDQGVIQQIGTPEEVYDRPVNLFVATFIGTPQMNLINGRIGVEGDGVSFVAGSLRIGLGQRQGLRQYAGEEVTMGIRPEALIPGDGPIRGYLDLVEHLGSESILHVKVDDDIRLVVKAPPDIYDTGGNISLRLSEKGIHLFHRGRRVSLP